MGLFSILPDWLAVVEFWVARLCLVLAVLTIGPWLLILFYDLVLYIFRTVQWELYGRHRGDRRPRAPSLTERPNGHRRQISLTRPELPDLRPNNDRADATGTKQEDTRATARATFELGGDAGS